MISSLLQTFLEATGSASSSVCGAECGYAAAFLSCLSFGSFGVPLKAVKGIDVDPLVFQSYKTSMCLLSSIIGLWLIPGVHLSFTPWGIISGLFWVPGGTAHICGIRTAGLAIAQGTSCSIIVMVSFAWGILVFGEQVYSVNVAISAVILMVCGICGMSYYSVDTSSSSSSSSSGMNTKNGVGVGNEKKDEEMDGLILPTGGGGEDGVMMGEKDVVGSSSSSSSSLEMVPKKKKKHHHSIKKKIVNGQPSSMISPTKRLAVVDEEDETLLLFSSGVDKMSSSSFEDDTACTTANEKSDPTSPSSSNGGGGGAYVMMVNLSIYLSQQYDIHLTPSQLGLLLSAGGGIWGGSVMVPLHFAGSQTKGLNYLFSFAVGASIVNLVMWFIRFMYHYSRTNGDARMAYNSLPSFHLRTMALPGVMSGTLWSIGNMASILSVTYLGEGVGYSLTQSSMLISGLWGVLVFKEIRNRFAVLMWFISAGVALTGIIILTGQHVDDMIPQPPVHKG